MMQIERIGHRPVVPNGKIQGPKPPEQHGQKESAAPVEVQLSKKLELYRALHWALQQVPEVRRGRVEAIKQQLTSAQHKVDSQQLAQRIVETIEDNRGSYRAAA